MIRDAERKAAARRRRYPQAEVIDTEWEVYPGYLANHVRLPSYEDGPAPPPKYTEPMLGYGEPYLAPPPAYTEHAPQEAEITEEEGACAYAAAGTSGGSQQLPPAYEEICQPKNKDD